MAILRTPDERFAGLKDYPFAPHYVTIEGVVGVQAASRPLSPSILCADQFNSPWLFLGCCTLPLPCVCMSVCVCVCASYT